MAFCGLGAFVGIGKAQRAHVYTATSVTDVTPRRRQARSIRRDWRASSRSTCARSTADASGPWTRWTSRGADIVDFHGVGMTWAGDMTGAKMMAQMADAYAPSLIYRSTNWIYYAGKPVYLLREPRGAVWVMQEFTKDVDPSLAVGSLDQVGRNLKNLPKGWTFETRGSRRDPVAGHGPRRRLGRYSARRTALHLPGLRLRRRRECELRALTLSSAKRR